MWVAKYCSNKRRYAIAQLSDSQPLLIGPQLIPVREGQPGIGKVCDRQSLRHMILLLWLVGAAAVDSFGYLLVVYLVG